ncbi:hypothetical protein ES288_D12G037400v1 [Gossypium darwinii]|uniref:Uncharacterized protein n=1 Tax=Gossypium darwinii TaxID=34276 RepID=A0A5D2A733_GOSDA|nr:hypothetical protein ES288_D12G037400v1 [Gossypium darwinii]
MSLTAVLYWAIKWLLLFISGGETMANLDLDGILCYSYGESSVSTVNISLVLTLSIFDLWIYF